MSSRRQNPRQKVRCQECNTISYTRTLDQDLICMTCGKYAKRNFQKVIATTEIYRGKKREVWIVV